MRMHQPVSSCIGDAMIIPYSFMFPHMHVLPSTIFSTDLFLTHLFHTSIFFSHVHLFLTHLCLTHLSFSHTTFMYNKHMVQWLKTIKNDKQASLLIKIFNIEDSYLAHFSKCFPTLIFEDACSLANKDHLTSIVIDTVLAVSHKKYEEDGKICVHRF